MDAQENQIFNGIIIAGLIIGIIISYFIISVVRYQKKIVAIQRENIRAEVTALEKDRARIAEDIHDDLSPMLVAVKMRINSMEISEAEEKEIEKTNVVIDDIAKRLRAISFDLMPGSLQHQGLFKALMEFGAHINRGGIVNLSLDLPNEEPVLGEQKVIHIYRIIQEIVHNTIKHAMATELKVKVIQDKQSIIVNTKDNGKGFDFDKMVSENRGLGLRSMLNRINLLQGEYDIESSEGKGTTFTIEIPNNESAI